MDFEDKKQELQDWFVDCMEYDEVAKLYHEIVSECDIKVKYMCESIAENKNRKGAK